MQFSFNPQPGPAGFGFAGGPHQHRHPHRELRNHPREHLRHHAMGGDPFGFGPRGGFGPGFGPGFGFGPGGPRGRRGHSHGRSRRGDVRAAILVLLTDRPMHGYEMIQEIADRSGGAWKPSPGSVYPTLQMLVDEGLILGAETDGKKKLFELTDDGQTAAANIATPPWEEIAEGIDPAQQSLRAAAGQLFGALAQSVHAVGPDQHKRIVDIVNNARREIYQILGESE
jgi:DNA-binding PadR family transcriptional regulator